MKKPSVFSSLIVVALVFFCINSSEAITIGFNPLSQSVSVGGTAIVALEISGLGDGIAPSLSTFDLDVGFDPAILALSTVTFAHQLDFFAESIKSFTTGIGTVTLFELSLDFPVDLDSLQKDSFVLASLAFDSLAAGTSSLTISVTALGDAWGDPLVADTIRDGSVKVPEPVTILFLGIGLAALGGFGYSRREDQ